ncbi:hypothetical protein GGQ68_003189 [Sagittula marina]|uniref:Uncharacterized protein n=1 Tax=Sagittula marina TaxID=943940 RepID=A0A7W6DPF9_9RHOB|nr:hypothetical protein [Sagittula marina]
MRRHLTFEDMTSASTYPTLNMRLNRYRLALDRLHHSIRDQSRPNLIPLQPAALSGPARKSNR